MLDLVQQFAECMQREGFTPPGNIIADGNKHRFSTNGKSNDTAGEYCLYTDGIPAGYFKDYRTGVIVKFRYDKGQPYTQKEEAENLKKNALRKQQEAQEQKNVALEARREWRSASIAPSTHPYLIKKKIKPYTLRMSNGRLLVPVCRDGKIQSLQYIFQNCDKIFKLNGCAKDGYFVIGEIKDIACVVEGIATGISVHEATGYAVIVAFSCYNLLAVAQYVRNKFPSLKIVICADNDAHSHSNRGLSKAKEAANAVNAPVAIPDFGDNHPQDLSDFNDLYQLKSLDAVKQIIDNALNNNSDVATMASRVNLIRASDVTPISIKWLWYGWIAQGKFHILAGVAGTGKTTIAIDLAATISLGREWPDKSRPPIGKTLIWSGEDDINDTLVPRLIAHGADRKNILFISTINDEDGTKRPFDPACDLAELESKIIAEKSISLLIIDPVVNVVSGDSHKNGEVRKALQPLVDLATKHNIAIVGITHFTKGTNDKDPLERVTGSLAFGAVARVVLATAKKVDAGGNTKYIFARAKSNICIDEGGYYYSICETELLQHTGIKTSKVMWGDKAEGNAKALLSDERATNGELSALEEAKQFLQEFLFDGPELSTYIIEAAAANGISIATLRRAKKELHIVAKKFGFAENNGWCWVLPSKTIINAEDAQQDSMITFEAVDHLHDPLVKSQT